MKEDDENALFHFCVGCDIMILLTYRVLWEV